MTTQSVNLLRQEDGTNLRFLFTLNSLLIKQKHLIEFVAEKQRAEACLSSIGAQTDDCDQTTRSSCIHAAVRPVGINSEF